MMAQTENSVYVNPGTARIHFGNPYAKALRSSCRRKSGAAIEAVVDEWKVMIETNNIKHGLSRSQNPGILLYSQVFYHRATPIVVTPIVVAVLAIHF